MTSQAHAGLCSVLCVLIVIVIYSQSDLESSTVSINTLRQILSESIRPGEVVTRQGEQQMKLFRKQQYDQVRLTDAVIRLCYSALNFKPVYQHVVQATC